MPRHRFSAALGVAALCGAWGLSSAAALDLTPIPGVREMEGVKIPIVLFEDGARKISYQPPRGWNASGGGASLSFYAPGDGHGWLKLMTVNKKPGSDAAANNTPEAWQAFSRQFLPKDAEEIALSKESVSPFTLEGRPSHQFTFTYLLAASRNTASIIVVDRNETQWLVILISADLPQFEAIQEQAVGSLFSWRVAK